MLQKNELKSLFTLVADKDKSLIELENSFNKLLPKKIDSFAACSILANVTNDPQVPQYVRLSSLYLLYAAYSPNKKKTPLIKNPFLDVLIKTATAEVTEKGAENTPYSQHVLKDPTVKTSLEKAFARAMLSGTLLKEKSISDILSGATFASKKQPSQGDSVLETCDVVTPQNYAGLISAQKQSLATGSSSFIVDEQDTRKPVRSLFPIPESDTDTTDVVESLTEIYSNLSSLKFEYKPILEHLPPPVAESDITETIWDLCDDDFELLVDSLEETFTTKEQMALVDEAVTKELSKEKADLLIKYISAVPAFAQVCRIDFENFPALVEHNPTVALNFTSSIFVADKRSFAAYLNSLLEVKPTLKILEFVKSLVDNRIVFGTVFFGKFVTMCIQKCTDSITARYISIFLLPHLQQGGLLLALRSIALLKEIKSFAQKYPDVQEAVVLFKNIQAILQAQKSQPVNAVKE